MTETWKRLAARIDALNLRERVFLFLAVIVVCIALVDAVWVGPSRMKHQQVRQQFDAQAAELRQLQDELRLKALQPDPVRQAREEHARLQAQIEATDRSIAALGAATGNATSLNEVLVHFLRRQRSLQLVRTGGIQAAPVSAGAVAPGGAAAPVPAVPRTGQELTIAGPYPELLRYVQSLETAMPDLRWGALSLKAEQGMPELTLQVFLVGVQP